MTTMSATFTRREYNLLPEGFPAQLIQGALVREPAPTYRHQCLVGRLRDALVPLVHPDLVVVSPTDVVLDDLNVFQPDVVVLRERPPLDQSDVGIPRVAFEVLSPSSEKRDRDVKRVLLLEAGVQEVWLLDPATRTVEIWWPDAMQRYAGSNAAVSRALTGFQLVPEQLFPVP